MSGCPRVIALAAVSILWGALSAQADSLRCTSINGNLNCVGSNGVSCQTVDGRKVCTSGHGDVIQSFGNGSAGAGMDGAQSPGIWQQMIPHRWDDRDGGASRNDPGWSTDGDD